MSAEKFSPPLSGCLNCIVLGTLPASIGKKDFSKEWCHYEVNSRWCLNQKKPFLGWYGYLNNILSFLKVYNNAKKLLFNHLS